MKENSKEWVKPELTKLGDAKELVKGLSPVFDAKNSLTPVDEFNTNRS
tara:strand:- start:295 stop:438 length:144 start_codon:yes stop_codon:yes gene_type:complete